MPIGRREKREKNKKESASIWCIDKSQGVLHTRATVRRSVMLFDIWALRQITSFRVAEFLRLPGEDNETANPRTRWPRSFDTRTGLHGNVGDVWSFRP